jgi:hypothetical protein
MVGDEEGSRIGAHQVFARFEADLEHHGLATAMECRHHPAFEEEGRLAVGRALPDALDGERCAANARPG